MQKVGFDMSETLLITDRGYKSMSNIQKQLDVGLKFLQCTPLNEKSVRALIDKHSYQLKGIEFYEPKYHCSAVALPTEECESWLQRLPGSGSIQSVKVSVYLYYDDHKAVDEKHCEMAAIDRVLELKMPEVRSMLLYGRSIAPAFRKPRTTRVRVFGCVRTKALLSG